VPLSFAQTAPGPFGLVLALLLSVLFPVLFTFLAAPGPFGLALALLLSVLFLLEGAEPVACRYTEAVARLFPVPLSSGLGWASLF
jgi:hypothetical protein